MDRSRTGEQIAAPSTRHRVVPFHHIAARGTLFLVIPTVLAAQTPSPAVPVGTSTPRPLTEQSSSSVNPVFSSSAPRSLFDVNRLPVEQASYSFR